MLNLIRAKACKRCGGDLSVECDVYGVYIQCIQCGANWSKEDLVSLPSHQSVKHAPPVQTKAAVRNSRWS